MMRKKHPSAGWWNSPHCITPKLRITIIAERWQKKHASILITLSTGKWMQDYLRLYQNFCTIHCMAFTKLFLWFTISTRWCTYGLQSSEHSKCYHKLDIQKTYPLMQSPVINNIFKQLRKEYVYTALVTAEWRWRQQRTSESNEKNP